jgi:hypothetical protein
VALGQIRSVLTPLRRRLRVAAASVANHAKTALRVVTRPLPLLAELVSDLGRSRRQLIAENTLLRQQLIVASRNVKRPAFRPHERGLVVLLFRLVRRWRDQPGRKYSGSVDPAVAEFSANAHWVRRGPKGERNVSHYTSRGGWGVV